MFKIAPRRNVEACIKYFLRDKELDSSEKQGMWMGMAAWKLGLIPNKPSDPPFPVPPAAKPVPVNEDTLRAVLRGFAPQGVPEGGRRLNGRYYPKGKRRCAYDCVLSAHKSISVAALCLPEEHQDRSIAVRRAWVRAVRDTLTFMESLARRGNANQGDIETRNLLTAGFTHYTSRRNDPQLHTHLLTFNATYDGRNQAKRQWYSLEPLQLFRQTREIDMVFQRELHRHLRSMGLNATMRKVDKITVTTLPVPGEVCSRLSQAHKAILAATALRWNRNERDRKQCRAENLINERCRPSKTGLLAARHDLFERALSRDEIREVVRQMGQPLPIEHLRLILPPKPPSEKDLNRLLFDAGRLLNVTVPNALELSAAALCAANSHRDVPFQPFYDHAHRHMAVMRIIPHEKKFEDAYLLSQDRFWHSQVDWFNLRNSAKFSLKQHQPGEPVAEADSLLPFDSQEPEPLAQVPEPRRAPWVAEALEVRRQLREKLERDQRERLAALAARVAVLQETARRVRVRPSTSPPSPLPVTPGTPSRSSRPERGGVFVSADPQTPLQSPPGIAPSPPTGAAPAEPPLPTGPFSPEQTPSPPLVDRPKEDAQPYLPQVRVQQEQRPQGP